jgi:hypothetical protein
VLLRAKLDAVFQSQCLRQAVVLAVARLQPRALAHIEPQSRRIVSHSTAADIAAWTPFVKPGGVIAFHEYSVADSAWATAVWNFVCWTIIIPGGLLTAPGSDIYTYLRRSVVNFDGVAAFE